MFEFIVGILAGFSLALIGYMIFDQVSFNRKLKEQTRWSDPSLWLKMFSQDIENATQEEEPLDQKKIDAEVAKIRKQWTKKQRKVSR